MNMMNLDWPNLSRVPLSMSALKEGAVVAVGKWSPRKKEHTHKRNHQAMKRHHQQESSEKKERWYTERLFRKNSLKKAAMWRAAYKLEYQCQSKCPLPANGWVNTVPAVKSATAR
jgi:hypothetical protein